MVQKLSEIGVNKFIIYKPELNAIKALRKRIYQKIIQLKSKDIIAVNVCKQCGNNFLATN